VDAVIDTADPERMPLPKPDVRRMLRPIGPVVVFDASNFPFAFGPCGGDTASALAVGNPVVVKAHPGHPATDELFAGAVVEALTEAGLPPGLFGLLQGASPGFSRALVEHPLTEAVGFTGSQRAGRALYDAAAARPRPIPVYAEMGSVNPLVVLPGALAERPEAVADGLAGSVTLGVGQFCTKPGLVFLVEGPGMEAFRAHLAAKMGGAAALPMLNATIRDGYRRSVEQAAAPGVETLVRGECAGSALAAPALMAVDSRSWLDRPALHEEVFGPAALIVRCRDGEDLLAAVSVLEGQLTGTLHIGTNDAPDHVRRIASALERRVGRVIFNGYPTGVEVCHAMVHGGPYPATTAPGSTSVGTLAIRRFSRPVAWQDAPNALLPPELRDENPRRIWRTVDGQITRQPITSAEGG